MNPARTCPVCSAPLSESDTACPRCLLGLAAKPAAPPAAEYQESSVRVHTRPEAPSLEVIAAAFVDYEVLELIGVGGMGAVYKARHKRLERLVALKVLPREISSDRSLAERFLREARALAKLAHPNIVAVHELGEAGGFPYLALEYVDGANLRALLREKLLEPRQALAIVKELCDALQYAHDEGVVHRDIKPENVLIDRKGRVRVADFGLAKLIGRVDDGFRTREDVVMGTPHYMAPEQLEHPRDVDHRADLYSLGVVFYEMLTGTLPRGNFELPSARFEVDVKLDSVVLKALEREPARRYQHAVDVKTDVEDAEAQPSDGSAPALARGGADSIPGFRGIHWQAKGIAAHCLLWLGYWAAALALWNLGPFALGVALVAGGWLVAQCLREKQAAEQRSGGVRVLLNGMIAVLGLTSLLLAGVALFERGILSRYEPPPLSVIAAAQQWSTNLNDSAWSASRELSYTRLPGVQLRDIYNVDVPYAFFRVEPWTWVLVGISLLVLCGWIAGRTLQPSRGSLRAAGTVVGSCLLALATIGTVVWMLNSDWRRGGKERLVHWVQLEREPNSLVDDAYALLIRMGLEVHGQGSGQIVPFDPAKTPLVNIDVLLAARPSPLERWKLDWHGALCAAPRFTVAITSTSDASITGLCIDAGEFGGEHDSARARERAEQFIAAFEGELNAK
jgi:tRNA A-37 threonylcarbamoyl transferase component Bud32